VTRTNPPGKVFAQMLFGALLSQADPRVVGLNFVAPEDDPKALADYTPQMRMLDYLHSVMPQVNVSLHAGELTLGLVPTDDLRFHVRQAVEIAHARRIGHGVDVMYEADPAGLMREMAANHVAVEINLTSNDQILGVHGAAHPFPIYRAAGVPTVLSTDDEGVERIDRTHELQRAVTEFGLDWPTLVGLERNTLEYAFVAGASLWANPVAWRKVSACDEAALQSSPPPACAALLQSSEKARLQWGLERDLDAFDREPR
jgi:adenosine deaminase